MRETEKRLAQIEHPICDIRCRRWRSVSRMIDRRAYPTRNLNETKHQIINATNQACPARCLGVARTVPKTDRKEISKILTR
jgi:hypothetical protein